MAELIIGGAIVMGILIGLVEMFLLARDEPGMWFKHALHAIPIMAIFVFASMNVEFVVGFLPIAISPGGAVDWGIRIVIGLLAAMKTGAAAALVPGTSVGESKFHLLIIGALVVVAPLIWPFLEPMIGPFLPI